MDSGPYPLSHTDGGSPGGPRQRGCWRATVTFLQSSLTRTCSSLSRPKGMARLELQTRQSHFSLHDLPTPPNWLTFLLAHSTSSHTLNSHTARSWLPIRVSDSYTSSSPGPNSSPSKVKTRALCGNNLTIQPNSVCFLFSVISVFCGILGRYVAQVKAAVA